VAVFGLEGKLLLTRAQQTTASEDIAIVPLPVPANVIGTTVSSVSRDGKRLVFASINNYVGNADVAVVGGPNDDANIERFLYDVDLHTIIQLTNTKNIMSTTDSSVIDVHIGNVQPMLSADGTKVAISSNASLGSTTNANYNYEIYVFDVPRNQTGINSIT